MDNRNLILTNIILGEENLWEEELDEEAVSFQPKYDKLPAKFSRSKPWPTHSNLCCMHCGCVTGRIPLFVPKGAALDNGKELVFEVGGAVCSFTCAAAEISAETVPSMRENRLSFLRLLVDEVLGPLPIGPTPCARSIRGPSIRKDELLRHGGRVSDQDFQKHILSLEVLHEPLLHASGNQRLTFG